MPIVEYQLKLDALKRELDETKTDKAELQLTLESANADWIKAKKIQKELQNAKSDKAGLQVALELAETHLAEAEKERKVVECEATASKLLLRNEIKTLKKDNTKLVEEKESLQAMAREQSEKMEQLEKLATKKEVAHILMVKEQFELKRQFNELTSIQIEKNLELDRLNDEVHQHRQAKTFVEGTFKGLSQIVNQLTEDNVAANRRHKKSLDDIVKFKSYLAGNLYSFDLEEEE